MALSLDPALSLQPWIALAIGNSRLHWALMEGDRIRQTWHTAHPPADKLTPSPQDWNQWRSHSPAFSHPCFAQTTTYPLLCLASVVPSQTQLWQSYPHCLTLTSSDVPLQNIYPSFGLDRAITLWGAGMTYGWPTLIIDAGTALTFTGADATATLIGGSILPGVRLQLRSLQSNTAALPLVELPPNLPPRWATDTASAIQSGIIFGIKAAITEAIKAWLSLYPESQVVLTGGDSDTLYRYLQLEDLSTLDSLQPSAFHGDPHLIFRGIARLKFAGQPPKRA